MLRGGKIDEEALLESEIADLDLRASKHRTPTSPPYSYQDFSKLSEDDRRRLMICMFKMPRQSVRELFRDSKTGVIFVRCHIDQQVEEERVREVLRERDAYMVEALRREKLHDAHYRGRASFLDTEPMFSSPVSQRSTSARPASAKASYSSVPAASARKTKGFSDVKPITWTRRLISRIFDAKFHALDTELSQGKEQPASTDFSAFVFDWLAKTFGLEEIVKQTSIELVASTQAYARYDKLMLLFQEFLNGNLGALVLVFFLMARSKVYSEREVKLVEQRHGHLLIPGNAVQRLLHSILREFPIELYENSLQELGQQHLNRKTSKFIDIPIYDLLYTVTVQFAQLNAEFEGDQKEAQNQSIRDQVYRSRMMHDEDRVRRAAELLVSPRRAASFGSPSQSPAFKDDGGSAGYGGGSRRSPPRAGSAAFPDSREGRHARRTSNADDSMNMSNDDDDGEADPQDRIIERLAMGDFHGFEMQTFENAQSPANDTAASFEDSTVENQNNVASNHELDSPSTGASADAHLNSMHYSHIGDDTAETESGADYAM
eukprot:ANDGO_01061.mRNA.1 hypothetical protein